MSRLLARLSYKVLPKVPFDDSETIITFKEDEVAEEIKTNAGERKGKQPSPAQAKKKNVVADEMEPPPKLPFSVREAAILGIQTALSRGPVRGFPLRGVSLQCVSIEYGNLPEKVLSAVVRQACISCVHELYKVGHPQVLEPYFSFQAIVPDGSVGEVLGDLSSRRRADIGEVDHASPERVSIKARVPANELLSYSKVFRSLTGGNGTYSAIFDRYQTIET